MTAAVLTVAFLCASVSAGLGEPPPWAGPPVFWADAWQAPVQGSVPNGCGAMPTANVFVSNQARSQSLRFFVRPTATGNVVRVRLSNAFGNSPLLIAHATVALHQGGAAVAPGSVVDAKFSGAASVAVPVGGELISDPVAIAVDPNKEVAISVAVSGPSGKLTWHADGHELAYVTGVGAGDTTAEVSGASYERTMSSYVIVTGLQIGSAEKTTAVVALGDSITDSAASDMGSWNRWLDVLGNRLRSAAVPRTVVNAGISCNQLLSASTAGGPSAESRFTPDVLNRVGISHVILYEGSNDIYSSSAAVQSVIDSLTRLANRVHTAGLRVIGATLIPRPRDSTALRDANRQSVNEWIRTTGVLDGVVDFDAVVRSATNANDINPAYNADGTHPNAAGHAAMGNAINLALFQ